jgi:hypothetical protein
MASADLLAHPMIFTALSILNLPQELLLANPCWMRSPWTFEERYVAMQLLPVAVALLLLIVYKIQGILSRTHAKKLRRTVFIELSSSTRQADDVDITTNNSSTTNQSRGDDSRQRQYVTTFLAVTMNMYIPIVMNGLSVFSCVSTSPSDGNAYLDSVGTSSHGVCYISGSIQQKLSPFAATSTAVYAVILPLALVHYYLRRGVDGEPVRSSPERDSDQHTEVCSEIGCEHANTVDRGESARRSHGELPISPFWIAIVFVTKLINCTVIFLWRQNAAVALSAMAMVAMSSFALCGAYRPYPARRDAALLVLIVKPILKLPEYTTDFNVVKLALLFTQVMLSLGKSAFL